MTKSVSIPEGPANDLVQTLCTLLDETAAIVWDATHDPENFNRYAAHHKSLEIKAKAHASIKAAFAHAKAPHVHVFINEGRGAECSCGARLTGSQGEPGPGSADFSDS